MEKYADWLRVDTSYDPDAHYLLRVFDAPEGASVLCVGSHDEPVANVLSDAGWSVTGIDLRTYDPGCPPCNYEYVRGDLCDRTLPALSGRTFGAAVALSCLEHFGLGTYGEGTQHPHYDVLAARRLWDLLDEGGRCFVTVPYGARFYAEDTHWRVYDAASLSRLVQDFRIDSHLFFCSGNAKVAGRWRPAGSTLTQADADTYEGEHPHVTVFLAMTKVPVRRLAADGR
jgi:hypothetical protein